MQGINVAIISLGCSKNLIDSERMVALITENNMKIVPSAADADVAVVNTCAFIDAAKQEAINTILETAKLKDSGKLKKLIVTGCLAERYKDEILAEMPEVDAVLGAASWTEIVDTINRCLNGETVRKFAPLETAPLGGDRVVSTAPYTAYIKIAEGCNNNCAFCIIPKLRGPFRSRPFDDIEKEARSLAEAGVKELIVVAQDVALYGIDIYKKPMLDKLIETLDGIDGIKWVRLHYLYPDHLNANIINTIAESRKTLHYFDIPIQHISSRLLRSMNRPCDKLKITSLFDEIRKKIPDAVIRTSIIAGLPGETEKEFDELCAFLRAQKLPRVGVFPYSKEEGTKAAEIPVYLQIDEDGKRRRCEIIDGIQSQIADEYNKACIGKAFEVLIEGFDEDVCMYYGRTYADSPDIDGGVLFTSEAEHSAGEFVNVEIISAQDYELIGVEK